jgi:hypothetical protein
MTNGIERVEVCMSELSDTDLILKELKLIREALEKIADKLDNLGKSEFQRRIPH